MSKDQKKELFESKRLNNCTLRIHDVESKNVREITSEKHVLAYASPVFEAMFFGNLEEAKTGVVDIWLILRILILILKVFRNLFDIFSWKNWNLNRAWKLRICYTWQENMRFQN